MYAPSAVLRTLRQGSEWKARGGGKRVPLAQLWKAKSTFMLQVFALFITQLVVTFLIMNKLGTVDAFHAWIEKNRLAMIFIGFVVPIALIFVLALVPMPMYLKLVLFTVFSACFGISLAVLRKQVSPELIRASLLGTMGIFLALFVAGVGLTMMGVNLWWLGWILFIALLGLIITSVVFLFIDESKKAVRIKAALAIVVFALFIMYDTNMILQRDYQGDVVTAAMDYYLDILNIFVNLLQLMNE
jgi:protein lifeguard